MSSHDQSTLAPYAGLEPSDVLEALQMAGFDADGRLLQLNSYENRVYQVPLEDGRVVVAKFYRPHRWSDAQIAEEHAFCIELAQDELPVVQPLALSPGTRVTLDRLAPTLGHYLSPADREFRFAVSDRRAGRAPELEQPQTLEWIGRLMARLHLVGQRRPFTHRRTLDLDTLGRRPRQRLIEAGFVDPEIHRGWVTASDQALDEAARAFERHGAPHHLRLHGDCHAGNVLWREDTGPHFVDLDDCCMGPAIQDLWMLLPGERDAVDAAVHHLLGGYRDFRDFDERELLLIEPLRTLRMIHHSAWLAERWADPAFPIAFPWFASPAYWNQQTIDLREQVDRMKDVRAG